MRLPTFTSEYTKDDLPAVSGDPLDTPALAPYFAQLPQAKRIEFAQQNVVLDAVQSYYFAKYLYVGLEGSVSSASFWLSEALERMCENLMKQAVTSIAATFDVDPRKRSMSLPHAISVLEDALANSGKDVTAEKALLQDIKQSVNADLVVSLRYVRHMRNKWAAHASLDRSFDDWADGDRHLSLPLVEEALVHMINAYQDLSTLIPLSDDLAALADPQPPAVQQLPDGSSTVAMQIDWSSIKVWAPVFQLFAQREAEALLERLDIASN